MYYFIIMICINLPNIRKYVMYNCVYLIKNINDNLPKAHKILFIADEYKCKFPLIRSLVLIWSDELKG